MRCSHVLGIPLQNKVLTSEICSAVVHMSSDLKANRFLHIAIYRHKENKGYIEHFVKVQAFLSFLLTLFILLTNLIDDLTIANRE